MTTFSGMARRRSRRPIVITSIAAVALAVLTSFVAFSPAGASSAPTGNTGNSGNGAIITPLLQLFEFGNTVGLPLLCSDAGSIVSIIGSQTGGASVSSKLVTELDSQCNQLATKGGNYLQQAISESRALTLLNPVVDPLIADLSKGLNLVGTQDGGSLAPFGPTVAGLGGTVAFFEGS
ncbi:MAG TPA: hypothetical protein VG244_09055 [Acidimicrobiales bacterium]|jgi:hypothetical protein|nr:hypothetical protein [Acidimicrobiales bacterium]